MKIPEKPRSFEEIIAKHQSEIFKLFQDKEIMEFVSQCNKEYIPWDRLRYKAIPKNIPPEYIWALLKLLRGSQYKIFFFGPWTFHYVLLDEFQRKLHIFDMGTAGRLGSNIDSIGSGRERYIISSLMEEAIASSQLEGAATTRRVAKEMLRLKKKPKNYSVMSLIIQHN